MSTATIAVKNKQASINRLFLALYKQREINAGDEHIAFFTEWQYVLRLIKVLFF